MFIRYHTNVKKRSIKLHMQTYKETNKEKYKEKDIRELGKLIIV